MICITSFANNNFFLLSCVSPVNDHTQTVCIFTFVLSQFPPHIFVLTAVHPISVLVTRSPPVRRGWDGFSLHRPSRIGEFAVFFTSFFPRVYSCCSFGRLRRAVHNRCRLVDSSPDLSQNKQIYIIVQICFDLRTPEDVVQRA